MNTEFEQKLAAMTPKLTREIILGAETRCAAQRRMSTSPVWRYVAVGLAGFLIGVVVTYSAMKPEPVAEPAVAERVVVLPLDDQTIGTLRSPGDLARIRPIIVPLRPVEKPRVLTPMSRI